MGKKAFDKIAAGRDGDARRPPHPGKTPAQRRALDQIGCGNYSPMMARSTRDAMLKAGLIEKCGEKRFGSGLVVVVAEYQMPIPVHMLWCSAVAGEDEEE